MLFYTITSPLRLVILYRSWRTGRSFSQPGQTELRLVESGPCQRPFRSFPLAMSRFPVVSLRCSWYG